MAKTKTVFRKALAVFLCGVMCFANLALGASADYAGWPSGNPDSEYYYLTMYADDSGYGTPQWDQSTGLEYMTWYKSDNSAEYIKIYYPSEIYLDVTETLQSAGYALHMEAVYAAGKGSDYRVVVCSIIWGELSSNYSEVSNDYGSSHAFMNMFDGYTAVGTLTEGTILASKGTDDADHIDDDSWSDERALVWRNPSSDTQVINEYIVLQGTPNSTGTGAFTTYGWNTADGDIFVAFQQWSSGWFSSSWETKNSLDDKGTESSVVINDWNDILMNITIYDKSELNTEIENAENFVDPNEEYLALLVSGDWDAYTAAKAAAETVLTTREVTQEDIESAKSTLVDAAYELTFAANNDELTAAIADAQAIMAESDYETAYTSATRQALETALYAAQNTSYSLDPVRAYNNSGAGKLAYENQTIIDTLTDSLNTAIAAMTLDTPDYTAYDEFLAEYTPLEYGICYTSATLTAYNEAVSAVADMRSDSSLTRRDNQTEVDEAIAAVKTAYDNLVVEHDYSVFVGYVSEPTCTEGGTATYKCSNCEATTEVAVAETGHNYVPTVVAPTCTEQGYTVYVCSEGDDSYIDADSYVDALDHDMDGGVVTKEATCTEEGIMIYTCQRDGCGYSYTESIPMTEHSWDEGVITTQPTCTEKGVKTYTCSDCQTTKTEEVAALGHDYVGSVTNPTCTAQGYTHYVCSRCDDDYYANYTDALGHNTITKTVDPTCTEQGYTKTTCLRCDYEVITDYTDALGHDYQYNVTKEAKCEETGLQDVTCSRGDYESLNEVIPATGHTWGNVQIIKAATCTEDGYMSAICQTCGAEQDEIAIPATGHTFDYTNGEVTKEATCYSEGEITYTCTVCGGSLEGGVETATIDKLDHTWNSGEVTTEATCTKAGVKTYTCTVDGCGETYTEAIPATGHSYETVVTEPTCTTQGYTTYTCTKCGYSYISDYTAALQHAWDEGVVTKTATCTENGEKLYTCANCGATKTEATPKTGHNLVDAVVDPTCTTVGYTEHTCLTCGYSYVDNEVPATGHTFTTTVVDPTCTERGYTRYECTVCGGVYRDDYVLPTGHNYIETTVAATCTTQGYTSYTCSICGTSYRANYTEATGHNYIENIIAPTCTEQGRTSYTCTRCGLTYIEEYTEATGHNYIEAARVEATKTKDGYIMYRCDKCGDTYKETLYASGQSEVSEVITDAEGNPLTNAEVTVTEVNTGETFTLTTDENGCLDYVFPEGTWELLIHKDGYTDTYAYITVADGDAEVDIPAVETNPCDCLCHQTNIFAKIFRIILKICKMFGIDVHCCDDSPLNDI